MKKEGLMNFLNNKHELKRFKNLEATILVKGQT